MNLSVLRGNKFTTKTKQNQLVKLCPKYTSELPICRSTLTTEVRKNLL